MTLRLLAISVLFTGVLVLTTVDKNAIAMDKQVSLSPNTSINLNFQASDSPKHSAPAQVFVLEQPLATFLRQAARRSGYEISLSKRVRGTLKNAKLPLDIRQIMPKIAEQFDLKWHFQKKQLFVSLGSEIKNRVVYLGAMKFEDLQKAVSQAGIEDNSYDMSFVEESNSVIVNGSVAYISNIELIIDSFKKNQSEKKIGVKVIRYGVVGD